MQIYPVGKEIGFSLPMLKNSAVLHLSFLDHIDLVSLRISGLLLDS